MYNTQTKLIQYNIYILITYTFTDNLLPIFNSVFSLFTLIINFIQQSPHRS